MTVEASPPEFDLDELDMLLSACPDSDTSMLIGELDGYLAGLLVSPHPIAEDCWLPEVWGGSQPAIPDDPARSNRLVDLILAYRDRMIGALLADNLAYEPIYEFDVDGSPMWEIWIEGFARAMAISGKDWDPLLDNGDPVLRQAALGLIRYVVIAREPQFRDRLGADRIDDAASLIPLFLTALYRRQHGLPTPLADHWMEPGDEEIAEDWEIAMPHRAGPKIGRNDPCPCGSGKKYKKCCLNG